MMIFFVRLMRCEGERMGIVMGIEVEMRQGCARIDELKMKERG